MKVTWTEPKCTNRFKTFKIKAILIRITGMKWPKPNDGNDNFMYKFCYWINKHRQKMENATKFIASNRTNWHWLLCFVFTILYNYNYEVLKMNRMKARRAAWQMCMTNKLKVISIRLFECHIINLSMTNVAVCRWCRDGMRTNFHRNYQLIIQAM